MAYWWLSFCDTDKPEGERFLGTLIVKGTSFHDALLNAWVQGLNPGGECWGGVLSVEDEAKFLEYGVDRLLTKEELNARGEYSDYDRERGKS